MLRWRRRSASASDASWLLADPTTASQFISGIVAELSTAPSAQGEKMSHGTAWATSGETRIVPKRSASAGGVINIAEEAHGYDRDRAYARMEAIHDTLLAVFERSDVENITTSAAAERLAEERIASVSRVGLLRTGR